MNNHVHIPENKLGVDYIIGDLHGCYDTFNLALKIVGFNPEKDRVFSVGDLVDRGRQSEECAQLLSNDWFYSIRGNHEQMAIDCYTIPRYDRYCYYANGGQWFMDLTPSLQKYYAEEFEKLPIAMTIGNKYGIVHADIPVDDWTNFIDRLNVANPDSFDSIVQTAIWSRNKIHTNDETIIKNIETIYCGHTPVREPVVLGNVRYIDTGCVFDKYLTIGTLDGTLTYKVPLEKET